MGLGLTKSHLTTDHTLAHWREQFTPRLLDRSFAGDGESHASDEQQLLCRAWEAFQAVRARYEPACVEEAKLREVERIVQSGYRKLCDTERREPG